MSVGFTGSRAGLTPEQLLSLAALLRGLARGAVSFAHGDCRGADDQAARIALNLGLHVNVLPGPDGLDAGPWRHLGDDLYGRVTVFPAKGYMERNRNIVGLSDLLVACPSGQESEKKRSGTWATVRMARERNISIYIVWPDGLVTMDGEDV